MFNSLSLTPDITVMMRSIRASILKVKRQASLLFHHHHHHRVLKGAVSWSCRASIGYVWQLVHKKWSAIRDTHCNSPFAWIVPIKTNISASWIPRSSWVFAIQPARRLSVTFVIGLKGTFFYDGKEMAWTNCNSKCLYLFSPCQFCACRSNDPVPIESSEIPSIHGWFDLVTELSLAT